MKKTLILGALAAALLPVAAHAQEFDGPYVGAQVGLNHDTAITRDKDAFIGGVFAGYDHEVAPNIVLGLEGGFSLGADDRIGPAGSDAITIDPDYSFDVSARAGYVIGDKTLVYARGGYANTRARVTRVVDDTAFSNRQTFDGFFVGGGVERKLLDNVSARLEYRFNDFDANDHDYRRHQLLAGVAYRF